MSGTNLSEDKPLQQHLKPHRGEPETPSKTLKTASSVVFLPAIQDVIGRIRCHQRGMESQNRKFILASRF